MMDRTELINKLGLNKDVDEDTFKDAYRKHLDEILPEITPEDIAAAKNNASKTENTDKAADANLDEVVEDFDEMIE